MSIAVECPHCESRYNLQPDLLGKPMRCPNPDCREVFVVAEAAPRPTAPSPEPEPEPVPTLTRPAMPHRADAPPPAFVSGTVGDLVPVVEAETVAPARAYPPPIEKPYIQAEEDYVVPVVEGEPTAVPRPALPTASVVMDAEPAGLDEPPRVARAARQNGPREVVWSEAAGQLAPPEAPKPEVRELEDDEPIRRRRSRRGLPVGILMGLIATIVFVLAGMGIWYVRQQILIEDTIAEEAEESFKTAAYPKATELFTKLLTKYPTSEKRDRYEFFNDLSTLHTQVGSVTFKENPTSDKYREFLEKHGDLPLAQPDEGGYGHDVFEAGRKIVDGTIEFGKSRLAAYRASRKRLDDLAAAEKTVDEGAKLLPTVEKYRVKDIPPLTEQQKSLDDLAAQFGRERHRLQVLAPWRKLADDPTDLKIAEFATIARQNELEKDEEAQQIMNEAKANLRKMIQTTVREVPAVPVPPDVVRALLFVAAPAKEKANPQPPPAPDAVPETFFAVARQVLYALDAETGTVLWAVHVGAGRGVEDLPVRVPLDDGGSELVLVPSDLGGKPAVTARAARTGEPAWHQPLEAPCAARPVLVGKRVYVPLLDDAGTVVEIEATSGTRLAQVSLRQRLGGGMLRQPGTGIVFVAAEGRRVFVLDVEPHDADGNREPMRCIQVLATDHPDQSLKTAPLLTGPAGAAPAPRFLVLAQAQGTLETRIRAFALPPPSKDRKPGDPPPEIAPAAAGSAALPGYVAFPPATDGERVAVVTDAGAFALYGTNQPGNQDPGLFPFPPPGVLPTDPKQPSPGQVVYAEEDDYWVLSRGTLYRLRLALTPASGLAIAPAGVPRPTGVPLHRSQVGARRDTVVSVVRMDESDGVWAIAMDPRDGRIKWQRKLGVVPPVPPVPMPGGSALLVDEDGGAYHLPTAAATAAAAGTRPIDPAWVAAPPSLLAAGVPRVAAADGGKTVWVLIPERSEKGPMLRARRLADGQLAAEAVVALPDRLAGNPVAIGPTVVVPLADGFVYRYEPGAAALTKGPQWRLGEGVPADAGCFLSPAGGDDFVGSDGGRQVHTWRWPLGSNWTPAAGPWQVRARVAFAPVVVPAGANARRLVVADVAGSVWLFDADRAGEPLRRWRGTDAGLIPAGDAAAFAGVIGAFALADAGGIPAGEPTGGFVSLSLAGKTRIVYCVANRHLVCLDPAEKDPVWTAITRAGRPDLLGWTVSNDRIVATDLTGGVTAYSVADGTVVGLTRPALADVFPQTAAVSFAGDRLLLPLWDGSAVFLTGER